MRESLREKCVNPLMQEYPHHTDHLFFLLHLSTGMQKNLRKLTLNKINYKKKPTTKQGSSFSRCSDPSGIVLIVLSFLIFKSHYQSLDLL